MSDDIDIEEHDILDNPHIKNIFPDLSVVKKEIEYFNEALPVIQESELSDPKLTQLDLGNKAATNVNKILNTDDDENVHKGSNSPTDSLKKLDTNITFQNKNKIIIGSKPNKSVLNASDTRNKNLIRFPKVFLHDVRTNLEKSQRYCKKCMVLFAEESKLTEHEKKNHSTPKMQVLTKTRVNPRLKKSNKNDVKSVTTLELLKSLADGIDEPLKKMDTSNETLGSYKTKTNISLDTSSSEEDEAMPVAESNSSDLSEDETVVESLTKLDVPRCRICHIRVANRGNLVRHYRAIHRKKLTFVSTKTTGKAEGNSSLKRSSRKSKYVPVNVNKTREALDYSNRCETCYTKFSSIYSLNRHIRNVHQSKTETSPPNLKIGQYNIKSKEPVTKTARTTVSDAENKKCFHCDKDFPDSKSLIEHVYQILEPKRTRNSNRILDKLDQAKHNVAIKNDLQADNETSNKKNLRPTKIKIKNNAIKVYNNTLNKRNEKVNKKELHPTKIKINKKIKGKKRFNVRSEITKKHNLRPIRIKSNTNDIKSNAKENNTKDQMYICPHCTYCFLSIKNYTKHIVNRHGTKVTKIKRQLFDPQCKYCSSNNVSALSHNRHLHKEHLDVLEKKNGINKNVKDPDSNDSVINTMQNSKEFAFKSAVFKCGRCDVHFISSETAKDHIGHIEILINWKCSICDIIFKKKDENMHLLQHLSSEHIVVYEFSSEALSSLLYNCTKCAIHFSEFYYLEHYEKCENETTISTYCKPCDILINEVDAQTHNSRHNQNETFSVNVITSDIIFDNKSSSKSITKIKRPTRKDDKLAVNDNTLTYCPACQCYMVLVRKVHFKRQCTHIIKHVCVDCGLQLTNKCIDTHRKGHKLKKLTIQDFIFTDMSGNIIKPPIPEYPQCEICKVYFLRKPEIISHVCSDFSDVSSCEICKIRLSNSAFKLHMAYHNYSFENKNLKSNNQKPDLVKKKKLVSEEVNAAKNTVISTNTTVTGTSERKQTYATQDLKECQNSSITKIDPNVAILFSCNSCLITLTTYDKLIEHCQNHPTADEAQSLNLRGCSVCNLKFDFQTYAIHNEIHANNLILKKLAVDFKHFAFDNKIWVFHVFQTLNPNQIIDIVGKSIYQNEHRVRFKILQNGPPNLTIYKCDKCSLFFDHEHVFRHAKCKNLNLKGTPCASCGLEFLSAALRNQHIKTHYAHPKITEKSYRILLFNQASNEMHSDIAAPPSQYIIYQCRNCNGVIDKSAHHQCSIKDLKKCNNCGLFIYKVNFKNHGLQHKNLINFEPDNMKVILLGAKEEKTDSEIVVPLPNFKGLIYDYTLYQCKRCEICVKNDLYVSNHVCVFGIYRCQCQKCEFFFNSKGYNHHIKTHNVDPDFTKENINIIQFDLKSNSDAKETLTNVKNENKEELDHKVKIETANTVVLYKCKCGLHFVNRPKIIKHIKQCNPKSKSSKQNCTKCSLLFNPSELFSHLVNHHANKSQLTKYDVKEITEENMEEFIKVILFNCSKCGLHYLDKSVATDHYKLCKGELGDFEECTKCKIIYDKLSFVFGEHNENCENMFEIEIIEESNIEVTADVDSSQKAEGLKTSAENVTTEP